MNKDKVVSHLASVIGLRFGRAPRAQIERELLQEGWSIGAIREALAVAH